MKLFIAIILGIIQGLTEFLPVSSSGHLVLFQRLFGIKVDCILFDVVLHFGTLIAIIIVYKKQLLYLIKNPFCDKAIQLYLATFTTGLIAIMFKDFFENSFGGDALFAGFFLTAFLLFISKFFSKNQYQYKSLNYKKAMVVGLFQGVAIMPGISRSGSTITGLMFLGVKREDSAEFSFILSIPIIFLSAIYELFQNIQQPSTLPLSCYVVGFIFSAFSGYLSINLMQRVIKKANYNYFIVYLLILSIILFLNQFIFFWF